MIKFKNFKMYKTYSFLKMYYIDRLKPELLNTTIFPLIASGLADASPVIRELTVRVS